MTRAEFSPSQAYTPDLPQRPLPIVILGAGGIVKDAHLPAYRKAGFPVAAIYNRTAGRAQALADEYGIPLVFDQVADAVAAAPDGAVFDIALMPEQYEDTLQALPDGCGVLIQKPLGNYLADTERILSICRRKNLTAAVNTQLRFSPYISVARAAIAEGAIGELFDLEVRVEVNTPWELFPHVLTMERLEINMHSVHYIDLIRSFLGDPDRVSAVTVEHPRKSHANSRSDIIMHYEDRPLRAIISTNHDHHYGRKYEESFVKWEGTDGALRAQMGLLMDYPSGGEDRLEIFRNSEPEKGWQPLHFSGSWFPDAFIGSMGALQRYLEGSVPDLPTSVTDVYRTMAVVEAAYEASRSAGVRPAYR
ncbi:Gfo/Idh/MocA family protein [Arthrobacter sp. B1805]|uniref:Gfo/Idh/MocA family oxidoreductase n=1 Tax=Arthrobacter sp. B1805 TaxID=2058892 RepID=UPI000CE32747|nr:Gfo/Idh/MocA family oxidoreductase [Arthrobacter sp. B1805]